MSEVSSGSTRAASRPSAGSISSCPGEVYGFLGPNGASKTTTVRMLVTLLRPTGGSATVAGFDVATEPALVRKRIGVALQEAALDQLMTGRELMELQATLHAIPRRAVRRSRRGADRPRGALPGGRAPGRLKADGTTVFLTTQYLEEADQLADREGIIADGLIVAEGTPTALKAEIGLPHLDITFMGCSDLGRAQELLAGFGELRVAPEGVDVSVALATGAAEIAPVVRLLDEAGFTVASLELVAPSLDDVFAEKTGRRLEGAAQPTAAAV